MIEVKWQILEQEGRVLKTICDLTKVSCKYIPKYAIQPHQPKPESQPVISSLDDLIKWGQQHKQIQSYLGESKRDQTMIANLLYLHKKNWKQRCRFPILDYSHKYSLPLPKEVLKKKWLEIRRTLKHIQKIVAHKKGKFICGDKMTVIDIVLYFDACNLLYFKKNYQDYPSIAEWFGGLYEKDEIKAITHLWFSMVKEISLHLREKSEKARPRL